MNEIVHPRARCLTSAPKSFESASFSLVKSGHDGCSPYIRRTSSMIFFINTKKQTKTRVAKPKNKPKRLIKRPKGLILSSEIKKAVLLKAKNKKSKKYEPIQCISKKNWQKIWKRNYKKSTKPKPIRRFCRIWR